LTDFNVQGLEGGTIGAVRLLTITEQAADGTPLPFRLVHKKTAKFARPNDPHSWRREYDLYNSAFRTLFTDRLRLPACYKAEIFDDEMHLWLEYIDGTTGEGLTPSMYERAAYELGRFQGKLYAEKPAFLQQLPNVSNTDYLQHFYQRYSNWHELRGYVRDTNCALPPHICQMLIQLDAQADEFFARIKRLPVVFNHRDFWNTNIFHTPEGIVLIDWDTAGWGYMGEDIASLIADDVSPAHMLEYFEKCIPAYYRGFAEYATTPNIAKNCIYEIILLMYAYRTVEAYKFGETPEEKALHQATLQKFHDIQHKGTVLVA